MEISKENKLCQYDLDMQLLIQPMENKPRNIIDDINIILVKLRVILRIIDFYVSKRSSITKNQFKKMSFYIAIHARIDNTAFQCRTLGHENEI